MANHTKSFKGYYASHPERYAHTKTFVNKPAKSKALKKKMGHSLNKKQLKALGEQISEGEGHYDKHGNEMY